MAMLENLAPFFSLGDFAQVAVIGGQSVRGVFDVAYALGGVGPVGMAGSQPVFSCATQDIPADPAGQPLVIAGATYTVAAHEPDGTGISRLLLESTT